MTRSLKIAKWFINWRFPRRCSRGSLSFLFCQSAYLVKKRLLLHSNEENREHWKYFWNVYCVLTNHMRDLVTAENKWVSQSRNRVGSPVVVKDLHLNLQEFKLSFLFIWEPHALRERKMCEWSLTCCGCIVATTAECQKRRSLFFNSLVYRC